jgi:hypothetical protein
MFLAPSREGLDMRRIKILALVGAIGLALAGAVWGSASFDLKCLNKNCNYKGFCWLGGIMMSECIDGYCVACDRWVRLEWPRKDGKAPDPLGKVWMAEIGKTLPVYACPHCKGPFLPVTASDMLKESKYAPPGTLGPTEFLIRCPKCGEPSLKMERGAIGD